MPTIKVDLDAESFRRLAELAIDERRPIPWQAEVLLIRALAVPVEGEANSAIALGEWSGVTCMADDVLHLPCSVEQVSDGYHKFAELYQHHCLLFIALLCSQGSNVAWRSRLHKDGTMFEGWFIAGLNLPTGTITYYLRRSYWYLLDSAVTDYERAPVWDGHTPDDVVFRLNEWLRSLAEGRQNG